MRDVEDFALAGDAWVILREDLNHGFHRFTRMEDFGCWVTNRQPLVRMQIHEINPCRPELSQDEQRESGQGQLRRRDTVWGAAPVEHTLPNTSES